jgi:hypothetical protein
MAKPTSLTWSTALVQLFSTLVGHYIEQEGRRVVYVDPLADDPTNVVATVDTPAIFLWAHNRKITYEYTGDQLDTLPYCDIKTRQHHC